MARDKTGYRVHKGYIRSGKNFGTPVWCYCATLQEAKAVAQEIFKSKGILVLIEKVGD